MPNDGHRWNKTDLSYGFDTSTPAPDFAKAVIRSAFQTWSVDGSRRALTFTERMPADILVQWSSTDITSGGIIAMAGTAPVVSGSTIQSALLLVNGSGRYNWSKPLNGGQTLYSVALHEIGHALGLAHSTALAVMLPDATPQMLQKDDLKSLSELYAVPPSEQSLFIDVMNRMGQVFVNLQSYPTPKPLLALLHGQGVTALQIGVDDIFYFDGITEAYFGLYAKNKFIPRKVV